MTRNLWIIINSMRMNFVIVRYYSLGFLAPIAVLFLVIFIKKRRFLSKWTWTISEFIKRLACISYCMIHIVYNTVCYFATVGKTSKFFPWFGRIRCLTFWGTFSKSELFYMPKSDKIFGSLSICSKEKSEPRFTNLSLPFLKFWSSFLSVSEC